VTPGADFLAASGAIALAVGAARAFIPITIINDAIGTAVFGSCADDAVVVSAAGFDAGLVAGMELLAAGRYKENGLGVATQTAAGVFVFDTARSLLLRARRRRGTNCPDREPHRRDGLERQRDHRHRLTISADALGTAKSFGSMT